MIDENYLNMSKNHLQSSKKNHWNWPRNLTQMTWTYTSLYDLGKNPCNVKSMFCYYLLATTNLKDFSLTACKCRVSFKICILWKQAISISFDFRVSQKRILCPSFYSEQLLAGKYCIYWRNYCNDLLKFILLRSYLYNKIQD